MTHIGLIFILLISFAIQAHEDHSAEELFRLIGRLNGSGQHCPIAASGDEATPTNPTDSTQKVCAEISKFPHRPARFSFSDPKSTNFCAPTWDSEVPFWMVKENRDHIQASNQNRWEPPTRAEFLKKPGVRLATAQENRVFLNHVEGLRNSVTERCCGTDSDCRAAMNEVPTQICTSDADNDPDQIDPCYSHPGAYSQHSNYQKIYNLHESMKDSREYSSQDRASAKAVADNYRPYANEKRAGQPAPGTIIFSPYLYGNERPIGDSSIQHEFAHACSDIQRQLMVYRNKSAAAMTSLTTPYRDPSDPYHCQLHPSAPDVYAQVATAIPNGKNILNCVYDLALRSADPKSTAYYEGACASAQLEEGFAQVIELMQRAALLKNTDGLCFGMPSHVHPQSSLTAECVLQFSKSVRNDIKKSLRCNTESAR